MASSQAEYDARQRKALDLRKQGMTLEQIAAEMGISKTTVAMLVPPTRRVPEKTQRQMLRAEELRAEGKSNADIAVELGLSRQRVAQLLGGRPPAYKREEPKRLPIYVGEDAAAKVREIAADFGLVTTRGNKIGIGSVYDLFEALASGELKIVRAKN